MWRIPMRRKKFRVGMRVQIADCSGIDSNKIGTITSPSKVRVNGRGVPDVPGHYRPADWTKQVPLVTDDGELIIMFKDRLIILD
jgi:hypothetical protein